MGPNPMVFTKEDARLERLADQADDMVFSGLEISDGFRGEEFDALDSILAQCQDGAVPDAYIGEMLRKLVLTRVERMRQAWLERQR